MTDNTPNPEAAATEAIMALVDEALSEATGGAEPLPRTHRRIRPIIDAVERLAAMRQGVPESDDVQRVLGYLSEGSAQIRADKSNVVWADTMARASDLIRQLAAAPSSPPAPSVVAGKEADAKTWGLAVLEKAKAQVAASKQASEDAFNNTFHKVKAEVSRELWDRIWSMACEWQRSYTRRVNVHPTPSAGEASMGAPTGDARYLLVAGDDGLHSVIATESELEDAFVGMHYYPAPDRDDDDVKELLEHFRDPDNWSFQDPLRGGKDRVKFMYQANYEGDWVTVIRMPDAAQAEPEAVAPSAASEVVDLFTALGKRTWLTTEDVREAMQADGSHWVNLRFNTFDDAETARRALRAWEAHVRPIVKPDYPGQGTAPARIAAVSAPAVGAEPNTAGGEFFKQATAFTGTTPTSALLVLLRRGKKQLEAWHEKYGGTNNVWLPPAGDVPWLEDVAAILAIAEDGSRMGRDAAQRLRTAGLISTPTPSAQAPCTHSRVEWGGHGMPPQCSDCGEQVVRTAEAPWVDGNGVARSGVLPDAAEPSGEGQAVARLTNAMVNAALQEAWSDRDARICKTTMRHALKAALGAAPLTEVGEQRAIQWPTEKRVGRREDMSADGTLVVGLDSDNDVYVEVSGDRHGEWQSAAVEFCNGGGGGGASPRTRAALINLMTAIEADNAARPDKKFPPAALTQPKKGD